MSVRSECEKWVSRIAKNLDGSQVKWIKRLRKILRKFLLKISWRRSSRRRKEKSMMTRTKSKSCLSINSMERYMQTVYKTRMDISCYYSGVMEEIHKAPQYDNQEQLHLFICWLHKHMFGCLCTCLAITYSLYLIFWVRSLNKVKFKGNLNVLGFRS